MPASPLPRAADFYRTFLCKAQVGPSTIHGEGVVMMEDVPRGTLISNVFLSDDVYPATEAELIERWRDNPASMMMMARMQGNFFIYGKEVDAECYLNHSETPNAVNLLGQTIALQDIKAGEEVTIHYGLTYPPEIYVDTAHGRVHGYSAQEALEKGNAILQSLLQPATQGAES